MASNIRIPYLHILHAQLLYLECEKDCVYDGIPLPMLILYSPKGEVALHV
jgi:hypothetical protein